jgi:hypothetical protein
MQLLLYKSFRTVLSTYQSMEMVLCKINNIYIYKIDIALIPKKKLRRTKGGAKNFGVFRVKNHDFTPRNHILHEPFTLR